MTTTQFIASRIEKLPAGQIFSYTDLLKDPSQREAVIKALNRMVEAGRLTKLSKGKYYKAEQTVFGTLEPDQYQIVKDLLEDDGKVTGYLTGYSVYNKLGLTTQISNIIQIGKSDVRPQFMRGRYTIMFVRQKNVITKDNITLLQILDAIRYIKKIPDATLLSSTERLLAILKDLAHADKKKMAMLSIKYPAGTRALLGAMLDDLGNADLSMKLRDTLNPVTIYKMSGISKILPKAINWNIK